MVGGLYSAAAGMAAQQQWLDALSNDVANVNTEGYKQTRLAFRDLAYNRSDGVAIGAGAAANDAGRSFQMGQLQPTDDPFSVAIEGSGFFQVRRATGQLALTRDGRFHVDANGSLVTSTGDRLVPPITLPRGTDPSLVKIGTDGTVTVPGRTLGKITVVDVPAEANLQSLGDNLYASNAQSGAPVAAPAARVRQRMVEGSNVDLADTMVDITQAQRGFELQSRVIQTQDQLMEIANGLRH